MSLAVRNDTLAALGGARAFPPTRTMVQEAKRFFHAVLPVVQWATGGQLSRAPIASP